MDQLSPFRGRLVRQDAAPRVVAPPHDSMTGEQRRAFATSHPDSFLNVLRSPADDGPDPAALLAEARATLERLVASSAYDDIEAPAYHVLRLERGDHVLTGIVGTVPVRELGDRVRPHEETRADKEDDLARHLEVVGVSPPPVGLVHRGPTPVPDLLDEVTQRAPSLQLRHPDGWFEQVWTLVDAHELDRVRAGFAEVPALYLTDGHHRAAAARRLAARKRATHGSGRVEPEAPWEQLLVAVFPETQLRLLPYHRVVRPLGDRTPDQVIDVIARDFAVEPLDVTDAEAATPTAPGTFSVHVGGRWYTVRTRDVGGGGDPADPVAHLDVTVLQDRILGPVLGIVDPRTDPRLEFVPGTFGLGDVTRRAGPDGAVFAVPPPDLRQLMAVADAGQVMPPKSTWFEPKLRSGVFLRSVGPALPPPAGR